MTEYFVRLCSHTKTEMTTLEPPSSRKASQKHSEKRSSFRPMSIDFEQDAQMGDERILIRRDKHRKENPTLRDDLMELTKPEITTFVALSAFAGFILGSTFLGQGIDFVKLVFTLIGVCLASGGGAVLNHVVEQKHDLKMRRTEKRPLPSGRLSPQMAIFYGATLATLGLSTLYFGVNGFTMILAAQTIFLYVAVYTPLKRITNLNTLIGTIPGALPALGGWTAATDQFGWGGGLLFAVMIIWQMPHFLAVAWMYRKDYARGGFKMTPVSDPQGTSTAWQMMFFAALLVVLNFVMTFTAVTGWLYLIGMSAVSAYFFWTTIQFYVERSQKRARHVLLASVLFIPALLGFIVLNHFLREAL